MVKRKDTKLESQGAEFLVLGCLLIEGVACYKSYVNFPGYDLTAVNPETKRVARIQVKSRWATDYDRSFPIKCFDCDFVVHVALNRGYAYGKKGSGTTGISDPAFYVFPVEAVRAARGSDSWGKVRIKNIPDYESYKARWSLIKDYLKKIPA